MKKVIGYVRVSSLVQKEKGNSIPNQIEKIESYCKLNGYELVDILKDDGISGMSKSKRKDYLKLIDIMEDRNIDGVVVNDLSRIGRKMSDVVEFVDIIKKKQIEFHSIKEGINNVSNVGGLIINILSSINQFEVEMLRNRISEVKQYKKSKNLVYGNLIYGKSKDGNRLIDNIDELKTIKYMKYLRKKGYSYFKISDRLNKRNIKSKNGNQWYGSGVRNILSYY
jgi:site-specific DNA recombinase|tara:strand:- start:1884 stop:2555 length:672 start_codon:yes stop_codon:yes gene_type:complete